MKMIHLLIKQHKNKWHSLGRLLQIQLVFLTIVVGGYLIEKLGSWMKTWPCENYILGIYLFSFLFLLQSISAPFIFRHSLPREKHLKAFNCLPLTANQTHLLVAWFYYKYQLPTIILILITTMALTVAYPFTGLLTFTISLFAGHLIYLFSVRLYLFRYKLPNHELHLEDMFPINQKNLRTNKAKTSQKHSFLSYSLIKKEFFSLWRNPFYKKLKIATWVTYMTILSVLYFSGIKESDKWMMLFSMVVFWIHYNVHFNTKYISADPEWYFRTLPVSYTKTGLAKFIAEIFYVLILLFSQWIFLILTGTELWIQLNWVGALLLFAIIILLIVINFQILFYDNPRLAGYAYHFTLLFMVIMTLNYRFVGPLTVIVLLTFYFFKTYRFYNS